MSMMLAVTVLPTGFGVPKVQAAGEMLYVGNIRVTEANASDVLGNKTISYQASAHITDTQWGKSDDSDEGPVNISMAFGMKEQDRR